MTPFRLEMWTNDGPSVTGRRPVHAAAHHPKTGERAPISSDDDLREFLLDAGDDGVAIMVAELAQPN